MIRSCGGCNAWHWMDDLLGGECRAAPPVPVAGCISGVWPRTDQQSWCRGFAVDPKPTAEEEIEAAKLAGVPNFVGGKCTTCEQPVADCDCVPF